jgi:hypothetical protein
LGRRPELVGGGMICSAGIGRVIKAMRGTQDHIKSDERILGDGAFIQFGLDSVKHGEKIAKAEQLGLVED